MKSGARIIAHDYADSAIIDARIEAAIFAWAMANGDPRLPILKLGVVMRPR